MGANWSGISSSLIGANKSGIIVFCSSLMGANRSGISSSVMGANRSGIIDFFSEEIISVASVSDGDTLVVSMYECCLTAQ